MKLILVLSACLFLISACTSTPREPDSESLVENLPGANVEKIDRDGIRRAFFQNQKEVQGCYSEELKNPENKEERLSGKLVLDFDITDEGKITRSAYSAKKSTLHNESLAKCISEKMKTWTFPKAPKGQTVQVFYPLAFSKK